MAKLELSEQRLHSVKKAEEYITHYGPISS